MNDYAYVIAVFRRTSWCQFTCRGVDVFSERTPTLPLGLNDCMVEVLSCRGQSYEEAAVAALRLLKADPRLKWACDFLSHRAASLSTKV